MEGFDLPAFNLRQHRQQARPIQRRVVGVPPERLLELHKKQRRRKWCWAAVLEMLFDCWVGPVNQEQFVYQIHGLDHRGLPKNEGAGLDKLHKLLNQCFSYGGNYYRVDGQLAAAPDRVKKTLIELHAGRPVIVCFRSGEKTEHAVLVTQAEYIQDNGKYKFTRLRGLDPWPDNGPIFDTANHPDFAKRLRWIYSTSFRKASKFEYDLTKALFC